MSAERFISHQIDAGRITRRPDAIIGALAELQFGLVAGWQLGLLNVGRGAVACRVQSGYLRPVHRGVYSVGHRLLSQHGRWMAAVLRGGPGAVLSHLSAACLRGLADSNSGVIHVSAPGYRRPAQGIRWHREQLSEDECEPWAGIPSTGPHRTLLDLAADGSLEVVRHGLSQVHQRGISDRIPLQRILERHQGHRGVARLKAILQEGWEGSRIRSRLEVQFRSFLQREGLPLPETNCMVELRDGSTIEVDCAWRDRRLVIELDSRTHHGNDEAFEVDRERDLLLLEAGWQTARVTSARIHKHGPALGTTLRRVLSSE